MLFVAGTVDDKVGPDQPARARAVPYLIVVLECDRPVAAAARFSLEGVDTVNVGRGSSREGRRRTEHDGTVLDLRIAAATLSTEHARVRRVGAGWVVEDCGSTNGTFVNGSRVECCALAEGDLLTVGRSLIRLVPSRMTESDAPADLDADGAFLGDGCFTLDPEFAAQLDALPRIARSGMPVLVRGETGTGKELLARRIHDMSGRAGPFVAINCGAVPAGLVESHFFGHVKGAFSGAVRDEPGVFRASDGGTLFLDEIAELPLSSQASLLRALQEREVLPVGANRPVHVDLRVVAATHQPLDAMVAAGTFRQDLFARLGAFVFHLPPLRERRTDFGMLVATLLRKVCPERAQAMRFSPRAAELLAGHAWPRNVRELEQCLARAVVLAKNDVIDVTDLPVELRTRAALSALSARAVPSPEALSEHDARVFSELLAQLARHDGNLANVALAMGKARMQVYRWCRRFGVNPNLYRK
jgi:DNA-binding NtrC family response regulator